MKGSCGGDFISHAACGTDPDWDYNHSRSMVASLARPADLLWIFCAWGRIFIATLSQHMQLVRNVRPILAPPDAPSAAAHAARSNGWHQLALRAACVSEVGECARRLEVPARGQPPSGASSGRVTRCVQSGVPPDHHHHHHHQHRAMCQQSVRTQPLLRRGGDDDLMMSGTSTPARDGCLE
jgi:hypothetical protein